MDMLIWILIGLLIGLILGIWMGHYSLANGLLQDGYVIRSYTDKKRGEGRYKVIDIREELE